MDFGELRSSCQLLNVQTRNDRIWYMTDPAYRERVQGIGGLFLRSAGPDSLAQWYQRHLGIDPLPKDYNQAAWQQGAGPTAFAPFPKDTPHFGSLVQAWMLNFRVRNLGAMVAQLWSSAVVVEVDSEACPSGRLARLHDPEGNPVELWEPAEPGDRS
jgi:glyoxylase I family protein